jgi:hypothetical protein
MATFSAWVRGAETRSETSFRRLLKGLKRAFSRAARFLQRLEQYDGGRPFPLYSSRVWQTRQFTRTISRERNADWLRSS